MSLTAYDLWIYAGALLILFLTPGPVWLAMLARALSGGFHAAWPLALGVAIGDMVWPFIAVLGVTWVVSVFSGFMAVLQWVACGVFILMGVLLIRHADAPISSNSRLTRPGAWAGFVAGLAAIIGNPKAALFYMGMLPGFFDLTQVTAWDMAAIVVVSAVVPLIGNLILAGAVDQVRAAVTRPATMRRLNIGAGALMIAVGVAIPWL